MATAALPQAARMVSPESRAWTMPPSRRGFMVEGATGGLLAGMRSTGDLVVLIRGFVIGCFRTVYFFPIVPGVT